MIELRQPTMAQSSTQPKTVCLFLGTLRAGVNLVNLVSEDCLTLDVFVPKTVWDKRNQRSGIRGKSSTLALDLSLTCAS